jgi:Flp pilus assembly protein TadG
LIIASTPPDRRNRLRGRRRAPGSRQLDRGQSLVEFALVFPIFIILILGIIDFGMGLKSWIDITNSAREAARWAAVNCGGGSHTDSEVVQKAVDKADGLGVNTSRFSASVDTDDGVSCSDDGNSGQSIVVRVHYDYDLITPLGGLMSAFLGGTVPDSFSLNSSADMRIE